MSVLSDCVRHGSEKKTRNRAAPVRAEDGEIGSPALCFVEDHLLRSALNALADNLDVMRTGPVA